MIWNHGSERLQPQRTALARFYTSRGLVFFAPHRRGHGDSPGADPMTEMASELRAGLSARRRDPDHGAAPSRAALMARVIALHERSLTDTIAAVRWLAGLPFVDPARLFMSGASHGGIQALLAAEAHAGARAYVAFAPGAMGWRGNPELHERLLRAVALATAPIFVAQAGNDFDLGPSHVLGAQLERKGGANAGKVFAAYGSTREEGHSAFACEGTAAWGETVAEFLTAASAD